MIKNWPSRLQEGLLDLTWTGHSTLRSLPLPIGSSLLPHDTLFLRQDFRPMIVAEFLDNVVIQPRGHTQRHLFVLKTHRLIGADILSQLFHFWLDVSSSVMTLNDANQVDEPLVHPNLCHDWPKSPAFHLAAMCQTTPQPH